MADDDDLPPGDEWQECAQAAEEAVKRALASVARYMGDEYHPRTYLAALFGAARMVGEAGRSAAAEGSAMHMEEYLLAYVRSGVRDTEGPIHEDGRPFEGTANA